MNKLSAFILTAHLAAVTGCASTPGDTSKIDSLEQRIESLGSMQGDAQHAPIAVEEAKEALEKLRAMNEDGADDHVYEHQKYLTEKKIEIAQEMITAGKADKTISSAEGRRKDVLLDAKEREVSEIRDRMKKMSGRADELTQQVQDLQTKETERGLVLTLGSVLFETNESELQEGAAREMKKVAQFLNEYSEREIMIEGFTDSRGAEEYNQQLSERRAQSVKETLSRHGVDSSRIKTEGYGQEYPVASNDNAAGRQQNRRVEIVISNRDGADVSDRTSMR